MSLYAGELDARDLFFILDYDKKLLKEVVYELDRLGYSEVIQKLLLEQSRNFLEFCYKIE